MQDVSAIIELYFSFIAYELNSREFMKRTRNEVSEQLCEFLESYSGARSDLDKPLARIVRRVIETHRMILSFRKPWEQFCKDDVVHDSLIISARLLFRGDHPDSQLVARLLAEIYRCDGDFRKILMGAYSDSHIFRFPLYNSRAEAFRAMRYFLEHTRRARKTFFYQDVPTKLADLTLNVPRFYHPALYAIYTNRLDIFQLLVEYGANLRDTKKPGYKFSVEERMSCGLSSRTHDRKRAVFRSIFYKVHPERGFKLPPLQLLVRSVLRKNLRDEFLLPPGLDDLPLPPLLKRFVAVDFNVTDDDIRMVTEGMSDLGYW